MPMRVLCEKCGFLLYEGLDVKTPYEIVQSHDGKCPKCAKRLRHLPKSVEIKPLQSVIMRSTTKVLSEMCPPIMRARAKVISELNR